MDAQNSRLDSASALKGHVEPLSVRQLDPIPRDLGCLRWWTLSSAGLSPGRDEQGPAGVRKGSPRQVAGRKARGPARRHVLCQAPVSLLPAWAWCASPCPPFLCGPASCLCVPACPPSLLRLLLASLSVSVYRSISSTSCPPRRLPADTTATVEDMLPSVTTVTAILTLSPKPCHCSEQPHQ